MTLHGITPGTVHVKLAEDETATLSEFHWNEANDTLEGSCGLKTEHVGKKHQCRDDCVIDIKAGGRAGYDAIVDAFGQYQKGDYGRLIMYNPCHPKLPPMAIMVVPTCNRFDKEYTWTGSGRQHCKSATPISATWWAWYAAMTPTAIAGAAACSRKQCCQRRAPATFHPIVTASRTPAD
jgi:hypothetical protein